MERGVGIRQIIKAVLVNEGAGVKLKRAFGYYEKELFDPFLLFDHFGSENPEDYLRGFPWHPHRGIETITYMKSGSVEHQDSLGNKGVIKSGDVQWMSSGSGIIHQEMPQLTKDYLQGFQLWLNMPAKDKMSKPKYRDIVGDTIPEIEYTDKVKIKLLSGELNGLKGPAKDLVLDINYWDVNMENTEAIIPLNPLHNAFCFIYEGQGKFDDDHPYIDENSVILFEHGDTLKVKTEGTLKFLLISGPPLNESIAWRGPIVMNSNEEIEKAFEEFEKGTFIK